MKKIVFSLLALLITISAFGQSIADGYYRVQSVGYSRYMAILDHSAWVRSSRSGIDYDLFALRTLLNNNANHIMSNPATVIRITPINSSDYTFSAQGVDVRNRLLNSSENAHMYIRRAVDNSRAYRFSAEADNIARVVMSDVDDITSTLVEGDSGIIMTSGSKGRNWYVTPIKSGTNNYFGFSPSLQANGKYYQTFYADFPFRVVSSGVKVYYVSNLFWKGYAVTKEFGQGDIVPAQTPVVVECSSSNSANNQVELVVNTASAPSQNYLRGVFFNYFFNNYGSQKAHNNRTAFNSTNMRVLRVTSDGTLAFVKNPSEAANGTYYLPANEAYLSVPSSSPDVLPLMSYDDYTTGIDEVKADQKSASDDAVYTLSGVRVKDTNNLPHGIYIIGGKKVVK